MLRDGIDRKYALLLLGLAIALLAIGVALKPAPPKRKPPPSERELARLLRLTEQRRLRDLSSYLADAARSTGDWLISVQPGGRSGVLWDESGTVITTGPDDETPRHIIMPDSTRVSATRVPGPRGLPLTVLKPTAPVSASVVPRGRRIELGDWLLAVARNQNGQIVFAHGLYQGTAEARCGRFSYRAVQSSVPLSGALAGGGVFTLDGELEGVIAECGGQRVAISTSSVSQMIRLPRTLDDELEQHYGFRVIEPVPGEDSPSSGAVIAGAVWKDSLAETAGLHPGDILLSLDERPLGSSQDLAPLITDLHASHSLRIRRARRRLTLRLPAPADKPEHAEPSPQGIILKPDASSGRAVVRTVSAGSKAAEAGIEPGDTILRVQGRAIVDSAAAYDALKKANGQSVRIELERDARRLEVIVTP